MSGDVRRAVRGDPAPRVQPPVHWMLLPGRPSSARRPRARPPRGPAPGQARPQCQAQPEGSTRG